MLRVEFDSRGGAVPALYCDKCGRPIRIHNNGMIQYFSDGTARIVHKNLNGYRCDDDSEDEGWAEIGHYFGQLLDGSAAHV